MPLRTPTLLLTGLVVGALTCLISTALAGPLPAISGHIDVPISTLPAILTTDPSPHSDGSTAIVPAARSRGAPLTDPSPSGHPNSPAMPAAPRHGARPTDPQPSGHPNSPAMPAGPTHAIPRTYPPPNSRPEVPAGSGHGTPHTYPPLDSHPATPVVPVAADPSRCAAAVGSSLNGRPDVAFDAATAQRSRTPSAGAWVSSAGAGPARRTATPGRASTGTSPGWASGLSPPRLPPSRPGRFGWPLAPPHPVVRPFKPPATQYGSGHRGVDLGGQPGEPVLAAGDGVVVFAGSLAGRGVVSIDHGGGLRTTYEPLTVLVSAGRRVERGTVIGQLAPGHEGCAKAPACLHWGARRGREYLDPLGLLSSGHVRLLPWEG